MNKTIAIIPARGGSKGLPNKNIKSFCGKPLLAWSILQAQQAQQIHSVWVSSDSDEILDVAMSYGAGPIKRPLEISGDQASSESAWIHAIEALTLKNVPMDLILAMQATSPVRESTDIEQAIEFFQASGYDSLFSSNRVEDHHVWVREGEQMKSFNYDFKNRKRRQDMQKKYLENGSFYIFRPELIKKHQNRLAGKIGTYVMEDYKQIQVDTESDFVHAEVIMKGYKLDHCAPQMANKP